MDFSFTPEQDAYRADIRAFLADALPANWYDLAWHGPGSHELAEFSLEFCPKMSKAGFLVRHWPVEHGGLNAGAWEQLILAEEMAIAGEPRGPQYMNVNWIGPCIMAFGSEEQKAEHLGRIRAGTVRWCQGFSEPEAGSDLAALRTRAEIDGEFYVINGSKIWTSFAGTADYCFLLARVGSKSEGRGNIAIFLVPMRTPGIEVRPIDGLMGKGDINEMFFTDVRVPASCRLGPEGKAWDIITHALQNERIGVARHSLAAIALERCEALVRGAGRASFIFIEELERARATCEAVRLLVYRVVDQKARGIEPGVAANMARYATAQMERMVTDLTASWAPLALCDGGDPVLHFHFQRAVYAGIAAGAAEIQLNLIARNALNLPKSA